MEVDPRIPTSTVSLSLLAACEGFPVTSAGRCFISSAVQAAPTRVVITLGLFPPAVAHKTRGFVTLSWCGLRLYSHFTHNRDARRVTGKGPALAAAQRGAKGGMLAGWLAGCLLAQFLGKRQLSRFVHCGASFSQSVLLEITPPLTFCYRQTSIVWMNTDLATVLSFLWTSAGLVP